MRRMNKIVPSVLLILSLVMCDTALFAADAVTVMAVEGDEAQTAAKTVRISESRNEGEEGEDAEEGQAKTPEDEDINKDGDSRRSDDTPVERMDVTEMTEVRIGNYEDWIEFTRNCALDTWSVDKYVVLTDNIDCNMKEFAPVPYFAGVFDGEGHTINKAAYTDEQNYIAVFSKTAPTAVIRDLNVIGVMKPGGKPFDIGGIVGDNAGMIAQCKFDGYVEGYDYIGGIAGYNEITGIISACSVTGKITGLHYVGGICGASAGLVTGCSTKADINTVTKDVETGLSDIKVEEVFTTLINIGKEEGNKKTIAASTNPVDVGGICGHNTGEISSSVNESSVGYEHVGYNIGGIVGRQSGYVHDCSNNGYVQGRKDVGGIVGQAEPYIRLDLSSDVIAQISKAIGSLHDSVDKTIKDTDASSGVVSARLNVIKGFADKALGDTGYLANGTVDFVNGVTGATNELAGRLEYVIDESSKNGGPMDDLSDAGGHLKDAASDLEKAANDLDLDNYLSGAEKDEYNAAKRDLKKATEDYDSYYKPKYDEEYRLRYYQALTGNPWPGPDPLPSDQDLKDAEAASGLTPEAISDKRAQATSDAANAAKIYADAQYTASPDHTGHNYSTDVEEYTKVIADTVLRHADEMADRTADDGKDSVKNVKKMAEDLRDAGKQMKSIIRDVASKGGVTFPQLSDEYRLHTNSLVANIQGMSDNLGFLNSEMKGSTDTVCADLEGVNDDFSTVMLLITDAMDGALDMDYSEVFEDESDDVCEESVDATVTDCENRGSVYADINTGGIAGTMAQEYDFDLEGDITGVKNAAKKSTYRTKCVLRNNKNRAEIKGKKSYAGGVCGLSEIGTILRCSNFAKVSSESSDYVGGIAGRSYSTIRKSYEKGVLAGESYIGGIAGEGEDMIDCVSMPTIIKGTNFTGAVAGTSAESGKLSGNVFVSDSLAGIDRISLDGVAYPISYSELLSLDGIPSDFSIMKVNFIVDDKIVATLDKKVGDVVTPDETPVETEIAKKSKKSEESEDDGKVVLDEDQYIVWNCEEEIPVNKDLEIEGEIVRFASSVASQQIRANKQSIFLVDGMFKKDDTLLVTGEPSEDKETETFKLVIPDDGLLTHTIRYQMPDGIESVSVFVSTDAEPAEQQAQTGLFGRFVTFPASGKDVTVRIEKHEPKDYTMWYIIGGCVLALVITIIIVHKILSKKRRMKAEETSAVKENDLAMIPDISDDESIEEDSD